MGNQPLSLSSWHSVLLELAIELACETTALTFVSIWMERRWRERALVILPLAAFIWILLLARTIQTQLDYWSSYYTFLYAHYPPDKYPLLYQQTQENYRAVMGSATQGANHLGWEAVLITEGMVLLGGALLLYWCGWVRRSRTMKPPLSEPPATPPEAEDGELEITIEPLLSQPPNRLNHFSRSVGKGITSRIESSLVRSITRRSMPPP